MPSWPLSGLLCRILGPSDTWPMPAEEARRVQVEFELTERRDKALREKFASASTQLPELARCAEAHGVTFSLATAPYRRAAILDFLDNPNAATDLDSTHFTSCHPSPGLSQEEQARMWQRLFDLHDILMRRDSPAW